MIKDNIEDLEQQILDAVGHYEDDVPRALASFINEVKQDLTSGRYKNRTGDLRRSIRVKIQNLSTSISMLNYGYYLSFGVKGFNNKKALGLPDEVAGAFGVREGYKFGSNKVAGIKPRDFYPVDLEEKLLELIEE